MSACTSSSGVPSPRCRPARERAKPIAELAKDLRISESCLRNWLAQAEADETGSETRLSPAQRPPHPHPHRLRR